MSRKISKQRKKQDLKFQCRRCNRKHGPRECPAYEKRCNRCGKLNHFETACRVKEVQEIEDSEDEDGVLVKSINMVKGKVHELDVAAWYENIKIDSKIIKFKLDTGAQVNILPEKLLDKLKNKRMDKTNNTRSVWGA